jgi:hypothetical protein
MVIFETNFGARILKVISVSVIGAAFINCMNYFIDEVAFHLHQNFEESKRFRYTRSHYLKAQLSLSIPAVFLIQVRFWDRRHFIYNLIKLYQP